MENIGRWIEFIRIPFTGKTQKYKIVNKENKETIGFIKWYGGFRKYSFFPCIGVVLETQCMKDIIFVIDYLMAERKSRKNSNDG